jgi:serine/threonine-protein kinase
MLVQLHALAGPNQGHTVAFDRNDTFVVGRSARSTVHLPKRDPYLSRFHFLVEVHPPHCRVVDLGSRNGIRVNDAKVDRADLKTGDVIKAGRSAFRVQIDPSLAELAREPETKSHIPTGEPDPVVTGFRLVRVVGRGGTGVVYEAVREKDNQTVALKVVRPAFLPTNSQIKRFRREADILKQLDHPNVVRYLGNGIGDGVLWVAMEFIYGENAGDLIDRAGPLAVVGATKIALHVLKGLAAAHRRGFVHRDVKPSNILLALRPSGRYKVRLADFGLARMVAGPGQSGVTLVGDMGGTPKFMPPEQFLDFRNVGPEADVYGTAATLYFLLTGRTPFDPLHGSDPAPFGMALDADPVDVTARRPDVPEGLAAAIHVGLAKKPADRHRSASAFARALRPFTHAKAR